MNEFDEINEKVAKALGWTKLFKGYNDLKWGFHVGDIEVWADTPPLAICRAFLKLKDTEGK